MSDTKERIYSIMKGLIESEECEISISYNALNDEMTAEEIGMDSISYIQLIVSIEDEFDIEFEDALLDYNNIKNFGELIKLVWEMVE